jgi:hypothetical protein
LNFGGLELDPAAGASRIPEYAARVGPATAVTVQLGDNAQASSGFAAAYGRLLDAVGHAARLACVSTWWENPSQDAVIKQQCEARGGTYVYIGDIFPTRQDDVGRYVNAGVDRHPHDWGMARIAERVAAALGAP